jgi:hypothetical protein
MKTPSSITPISIRFISLFVLSLFLLSCSGYQNVSYYETDGIYASSAPQRQTQTQTQSRQTSVAGESYQNYFRTLRNDVDQNIIVDEEQYTSIDTTALNLQRQGSWGNNDGDVIVNVYGGNAWADPFWGWGGGWWGPGWG